MSGIMDPQIEFYIDTVYTGNPVEMNDTTHFKMFVYEDGSNLPEYTERQDGMGGTIRDYNWVVDWNKKIVTLLSPKRNYNYSICLYIDMVRMKPVLEAHNKYDMSVFDTIK